MEPQNQTSAPPPDQIDQLLTKPKHFDPFQVHLKWYEVILCGLPMLLFLARGMLGVVIGIMAFTLNVKIWQKNWNIGLKLAAVIGVTIFSILAALVIVPLAFLTAWNIYSGGH